MVLNKDIFYIKILALNEIYNVFVLPFFSFDIVKTLKNIILFFTIILIVYRMEIVISRDRLYHFNVCGRQRDFCGTKRVGVAKRVRNKIKIDKVIF